MRNILFQRFIVCLLVLGSIALTCEESAQVELTMGFHVRNVAHWAGGLKAACIGTEGIRSPVGGGTQLITPSSTATLLNAGGLKTPRWAFGADKKIFQIRISDVYKASVRPVAIRLYDKNSVQIATMDNYTNTTWTAPENSEPAAFIEGEGSFDATGLQDNAGTHVVLQCNGTTMEIKVAENPMFPEMGNLIYLDGQRTDLDLVVKPTYMQPDLRQVSWSIDSGGGWNPSGKNIEFTRNGSESQWFIPNCRWYLMPDPCANDAPWKFTFKGKVRGFNVKDDETLTVSVGQWDDPRPRDATSASIKYINGMQVSKISNNISVRESVYQRRLGLNQPWYGNIIMEGGFTTTTGLQYVKCLTTSQWYHFVKNEEDTHKWQFSAPNGNGVVRSRLRDITRTLQQLEANLRGNMRNRPKETVAEAELESHQAAQMVMTRVSYFVGTLSMAAGSSFRCSVEQEAKTRIRMPSPSPLDMTCAYPVCRTSTATVQGINGISAFSFELPSTNN